MHFSLSTSALRAEDRRTWTWVAIVAAALFAAWLAWLILARVPLYVASDNARVEVRQAGHSVDAPDTARVNRVLVTLGQSVRSGELLVQLDDTVERLQRDELVARITSQRAGIAALGRQGASLQAGLRDDVGTAVARRREAEEALRSAEAAARLAEEEVRRIEALHRAQLVSESALASARAGAAQRRAEAQGAAAAVGRASTEGRASGAEQQAALENVRSEEAELRGAMEEASVAVRRLDEVIARRAIKAPVGGTVGDLARITPGMAVQSGTRLAVIVPGGNTHIVAEFLPHVAGGRVEIGQRARFRLQPFAWSDAEVISARVTRVATEPAAGAIRVELATAPGVSSRWLQHGVTGTAEVETERLSPLQLILRSAGRSSSGSSGVPRSSSAWPHSRAPRNSEERRGTPRNS
jgi:multidrug resistance efflux pump